jgi:hypothetical protein
LTQRDLLAIELRNEPFTDKRVSELKKMTENLLKIGPEMTKYFVFTSNVSNLAYATDAP